MIKVSICDDNKITREELCDIVNKYFVGRKIPCEIRCCFSGENLLEDDSAGDIVFLDVEMPGLNGIQAGYEILARNPEAVIIFVTSFEGFLDEAMDMKAFRYLLKPVDKKRLYSALDTLTERRRLISFVSGREEIFISEADMVMIYSDRRKTYILTDMGKEYPTTVSIKQWSLRLSLSEQFTQPHYSYIINMKYVADVKGRNITMMCKNGKNVCFTASQRRFKQFRRDYISVIGKLI
ncbi:MAG: response regulator transcription factor [Ruminococcus sp.]|nr:response regulator transcription factor [Ruminococcus sp.]